MIPADDRGLTLGDGLFETILARDGELVLFEAHLKRMTAGCRVLGLPAPDAAEARRVCEDALHFPSPLAGEGGLRRRSDEGSHPPVGLALTPAASDRRATPHPSASLTPSPARGEGRRFAVRLTLTAGSGGRGLDRPTEPTPRLFATVAPAPKPDGPIALTTVSVRRNEGSPASRLKTLAYLDQVLARREAGDGEALMLNNRGELACAAAANLFWLADGVLRTPALACGVLDGIMRGQTIAAARALGMPVQEVVAARGALDGVQAVFLTNSLIGLRRVERLDGVALGEARQVSALAEALEAVS
jgi:branched-subunit amino acid aminotransferase/4-amino-4-deoxychorismate lyase